jgi:hypothetical protein
MTNAPGAGGCQCGAVRFSVSGPLGRASICHCRMCQKAFGGPYGALVSAPEGMTWTRGTPSYFQSSNRVRRGFCGTCGTPMTFESDDGPVELAIAIFDHTADITPVIQHARGDRLAWTDDTAALPVHTPHEAAQAASYYASIVSHQHPDHDTPAWPR